MSIRRYARTLGLGRLVYQCWHRPQAQWRQMIAAGGPVEVIRTACGRRQMEAAALALPSLSEAPARTPLQIYLLTGRRYWYQAAFCLWTFGRHTQRSLAPVIYDDGTLETWQQNALRKIAPRARFRTQQESMELLDRRLPLADFPILRDRWRHYPNIRKLIDPHLEGGEWKLVIDSDLLFFRRPSRVVDWLEHPKEPLHAVDCETCYGYPIAAMEKLAGAPIRELVNVGLCGLNSSEMDWPKLERWSHTLVEQFGTHYYLEQAIVAMLVAGRRCTVMPSEDYVTLPRQPEVDECRAVMHHYVAESKRWYFRQCWRKAIE